MLILSAIKPPLDNTILCFCLLALTGLALIFGVQSTKRLPPGPPGHFLIGHALKVPVDYQWKTFADWAKRYGAYPSSLSNRRIS